MLKHLRTIAVLIAVFTGAGFWVSAQQGTPGPTALSGQDYGEIEALYARYSQGSDFSDD